MSEVSVMINQAEAEAGEEEAQLDLPPGFRFHPTDEEVVTYYLTRKAQDRRFSCVVIADVNLNNCEPWDLPSKAKMGEKEWFFFCHKDRKYPTGMRTNRATASGYWKATGKDKEIFRGRGVLVGMKKTLVFYMGRAPRGEKTPWVMHEYRLEGKLPPDLPRSAKDEWAVCRVFNKDLAAKNAQMAPPLHAPATDSFAFLDDFLDDTDLPALMDPFADVGAEASTSTAPAMAYQQAAVKTESHPQTSYFSLPTAPNHSSGTGFLHQAAMPGLAIRRFCKAEAPATSAAGADTSLKQQYVDPLDDLLYYTDSIPDYSHIWKNSDEINY
ncbi:hypothetical protein E2562_018381 [Oryza meyeriana var. granulata]|uniref:NAC domain-containing protein n=1 Tax=Oryza meyeriana var. granulata TaxID=110450 RepID=A0A6G1D5Y9_9ORYZ|nr:hypothetical protein E2562_018381 [Oryza meyeriana var. granulata]